MPNEQLLDIVKYFCLILQLLEKHARCAWMTLISSMLSGCPVLSHADTDPVWTAQKGSRTVQTSSVRNVGNLS